MKQILMIVSIIIIISSRTSAQLDSISTTDKEVMLMGGISFPYLPAEYRDIWKKGWNGGIGYGYSFAPGSLGYGAAYATAEYNRYALDPVRFREHYGLDPAAPVQAKGSAQTFTVMLNVKGSFSPSKRSVAPYFFAGIGYIYYRADSLLVGNVSVAEDKASAFCWSFGVGIEAPLTQNIGIFAQGKSLLGVFTDTKQFFPLSGGVRIKL